MNKRTRDKINQSNAQHSTGPNTPEGKQRSSMNAFKHGLTGHNLMLQADEQESYDRISRNLHAEHNPQTETERQLVQQIIHCMLKLNRAAALENNIFSFATLEHATDAPHDDATETMAAQTRAWLANEKSFDQFGRYSSRLSKDLFRFQRELERLQDHRKADAVLENLRSAKSRAAATAHPAAHLNAQQRHPQQPAPAAQQPAAQNPQTEPAVASQAAQTKPVKPEMASFRQKAENCAPLHNEAPAPRPASAATPPPAAFHPTPQPAPECPIVL